MDVYEATIMAKALTENRQTFSIEFYGFDESNDRTTGVKRINQCLVRPGNPADRNDDFKLALQDEENNESRSCWIPLIKSINGINVITP